MTRSVATPLGLRSELEDFYADYLLTIDEKRPNDWIAMFADPGLYAVTTHNNHATTGMWWHTDRGLNALKERAAFTNGYFWHNPTKTLHTVSNIRATELDDGRIKSNAYFVMYSSDRGDLSQLYVCGVFDDIVMRTDGAMLFEEHRAIVDSETVPPNMGVLL